MDDVVRGRGLIGVLAGLIVATLGAAIVMLWSRGALDVGSLIAGGDVPCVHSSQVDRDAPERYASAASAIEADEYASTERDLVEEVPDHPAFHRFRSDTAVYWVEDEYDGSGWKVVDRYRLGRCDRDAFTGRGFRADQDRPLRACDHDDSPAGPIPPDADVHNPDSPWVCSAEHLTTRGRRVSPYGLGPGG